MTENNSPLSPYILATPLNDDPSNLELALKTQPFYSLFYETGSNISSKMKEGVKTAATNTREKNRTADKRMSCMRVFDTSRQPDYWLTENIPFTRTNLLFLLVVFMTTVLTGVLTCSYWMALMDSTEDDNVVKTRTIILSVFFLLMLACLSAVMYEFFTLKLSLMWFRKYVDGEPTPFYKFVLNTRKVFLWAFVVFWLFVVIYTTVVVSKRTEKFKELIVVNVVSCIVLLVAQYAYYKTQYRTLKVFCVGVSVGVITLILYLLYGL